MKESEFIAQNKKKWEDFENNLQKKDADPSTTTRLFIEITDDLSYARTFYRNRSVRLYLNGIARLLFNDINRSQRNGLKGFQRFWTHDLPLTMYGARRTMVVSLLVFIACFTLGVVTSIHDKDFAAAVLSSDYVNMTEENIKKGDPMAVYKSDGEAHTFLMILYNNVRVDLITFFSGIFMAIGSLVVMVSNGVMVGVFQYFFIERDLFWESFLTIWTHGSLEIPTIILSGGAGLTLGKGLLFPGTHSRLRAFRLSGMAGLKLLAGVLPVTCLAAFIEGFLTRHTGLPDTVRLLFILANFAFIVFYFIVFPRRVAQRTAQAEASSRKELIYAEAQPFDTSEILPGDRLITETFRQFFMNFSVLGKYLLLLATGAALLVGLNPMYLLRSTDQQFSLTRFFYFDEFPLLAVVTGLCMATAIYFVLVQLHRQLCGKPPANRLRLVFSSLFASTLFSFITFTGEALSHVTAQALFPLLCFICAVSAFDNRRFGDAIAYAFTLLSQSWARFFLSMLVFFVVSWLSYLTFFMGLKQLFVEEALAWALTDQAETAGMIQAGCYAFELYLAFFIYLSLSLVSGSLLYFTLKEMLTANHLVAKIKAIRRQS